MLWLALSGNQFLMHSKVELDFDGLEWIGQGFAHQLFVVFAKNHPDIKLDPVNMSDEVIRMYNHVTENNKI